MHRPEHNLDPPDEELPEFCPICKHDNVDEAGEWLSEYPPFCSKACKDLYVEEVRKEAEAEYKEFKASA